MCGISLKPPKRAIAGSYLIAVSAISGLSLSEYGASSLMAFLLQIKTEQNCLPDY